MAQPTVKVYSDYKSPYAYLAKDLIYELERDTGPRQRNAVNAMYRISG
jgi:2-hydroxychromene-2-carboxylate isomerase